MATGSACSHFSENGSRSENEQTVVSLLEQILPTKDSSEVLPLALCESVLHENSSAPCNNNSSKKKTDKKWYLQLGLPGVFAINNHLYERRKNSMNSRGETVMYLKCIKFRSNNCKNGRAVLVIDKDGNKKIRNCCEDEEHTHPPPFEEVVKRNVKLKLKALTERHPEKTTTSVYRQIVREETLAYSEIDPAFCKYIPKFDSVRTFLHKVRQRVREEKGIHQEKKPRLSDTTCDKVEVNGLKKSSEYLPFITSVKQKIKEEVISSSDENSCGVDDPVEPEVAEGTSNQEGLVSATTNIPSVTQVQQFPFERPTVAGVLQTNNDCTLPSIVAVMDSSMANTNQSFCDQLNFQNRSEHLAKNWSEKLKSLRNDQRIYAEKLINDVLYEAELCLLNHGCRIYNVSSQL